MMRVPIRTHGTARRGNALVVALVSVTALAGLAAAAMTVGVASKSEVDASRSSMNALYLAEIGVSESLMVLNTASKSRTAVDARAVKKRGKPVLGTAAQPMRTRTGEYWAELQHNVDDDTWTVIAHGISGGVERQVEAVIGDTVGAFANAVFAGNSGGDPLYSMPFGGKDHEADLVIGDVYSGGNIDVTDDAELAGTLRAGGYVFGAPGESEVVQPIPDIAGMDYANNHDVDVLQEFVDHSSYAYDNAGGYAYQLPENNLAHIFRANPSDRRRMNDSTEKHDFYLEDPYESFGSDIDEDGVGGYGVSLSGQNGNGGADGSGKVYFIDGNLWIHNYRTLTIAFEHLADESVQVTFVVSGNVYISDNVFYTNPDEDAVALIAIRDEDVDDSGNIYFGDPEFGTIRHMDGYMYAENNFYDYNLDKDGSVLVEVFGNMTAGNQVAIDRDHEDHHSKLRVEYDSRLADGLIDLPGIPINRGQDYRVLSWRELSEEASTAGFWRGGKGEGEMRELRKKRREQREKMREELGRRRGEPTDGGDGYGYEPEYGGR